MNAIKTLAEARKYAIDIAKLRNEPVHIFKVAKGTVAYEYGYRLGTCLDSEREAYERDGVNFLETIYCKGEAA